MRTYRVLILMVPCFILSLSGCRTSGRTHTPVAPQQRPLLGTPTPFDAEPSSPTPANPRPYEEPKLITPPPPPAPSVSLLNRRNQGVGGNRPSKVVRSNRSGLFANQSNKLWGHQLQNLFLPRKTQQNNKTHFGNSYPQHLSVSQFNKQRQQALYQSNRGRSQHVAFDRAVSSPFDQPIALGFDATGTMPQPYSTQAPHQSSPSLYGQREQKPTSNYSGIDNWNLANWHSPSHIEDWKKQRRPRQMTPSNTILPVMSVPQDASADDVEQWPHLEKKVESIKPTEVLERPVFEEDKEHVIIIQPRRR